MAKRIAKTAREVPTLGKIRQDADGVVRGQITGACGCVTHFEVCTTEYDENGLMRRLVGLSDAKSPRKSGAESGPEDAP